MTTRSVRARSPSSLASACLPCRSRRGGALDQSHHGVGKLGTLVLPVIDAVKREAQRLLALSSDRVVEAHPLDETSVAAVARVGHDDIVKGPLLGAAPGQSDHHHCESLPVAGKKTLIICRNHTLWQPVPGHP